MISRSSVPQRCLATSTARQPHTSRIQPPIHLCQTSGSVECEVGKCGRSRITLHYGTSPLGHIADIVGCLVGPHLVRETMRNRAKRPEALRGQNPCLSSGIARKPCGARLLTRSVNPFVGSSSLPPGAIRNPCQVTILGKGSSHGSASCGHFGTSFVTSALEWWGLLSLRIGPIALHDLPSCRLDRDIRASNAEIRWAVVVPDGSERADSRIRSACPGRANLDRRESTVLPSLANDSYSHRPDDVHGQDEAVRSCRVAPITNQTTEGSAPATGRIVFVVRPSRTGHLH